MIKTKNGRTKVKGNSSELATNLAHATSGVIDAMTDIMPRKMAVEIVKKAVEIGCMTGDERRAKAEQQADAFIDALRYAFEAKAGDVKEEGEQAEKNGKE